MSIKKILFIVCLISGPGLSWSQQMEVRYETGFGTYAMSDLKDFQKMIIPNYGFEVKSLDKFPPYWYYGLNVLFGISEKFNLGVVSRYYSTGARNHYADYSGSYKDDMLAKAVNLGVNICRKNELAKNLYISAELATGIKFSKLSLEEEIVLLEEEVSSGYDFFAISFWAEPQIRIQKNLFNLLSFSVYSGYEINTQNKLRYKDENDQYLLLNNSEYAKIDWSGLRAGIALSIYL